MCAGCLSSFDAMAVNAVGATAAAGYQVRRLRRRFNRSTASMRKVQAWERDAQFCRHLDLDPVSVLGPVPRAEAGKDS